MLSLSRIAEIVIQAATVHLQNQAGENSPSYIPLKAILIWFKSSSNTKQNTYQSGSKALNLVKTKGYLSLACIPMG